MLLRPKTQLQDMTVEVNPGTPATGQLQERRDDPALADGSERQLRRIPRGARRAKRARTCRSCSPVRAKASRTTAGRSRRPSSALTRSRAMSQRDRPAARNPPHEHRPLDPQLPAADRSAGRQGQAARVSWSMPPTRCSRRSPRRTRTSRARCDLLPGALHKDQNRTRQARARRRRARADAAPAAPVRQLARTGATKPRGGSR